ncbi:neurensin-2 [Sphaerodactylus townsendi]|uniref:Uncharacterized protein n=1 Tax=Sphaerodactylus townsendi TaxID=933632 RepID=A0ACB8F6K1_9SAUR|nr:neurensin-2 [Sphaerodactylus townsendi]XP_048354530.1 neurensin-2 [Sphaerodactylus townsendi]
MPATCDRSCDCHHGPNVERGKWYGVHSYLHLFYEDCTSACPHENPEPAACSGWKSVLWKAFLSAGTLLLLIGAAAVATGFLLPSKLEEIGAEEFMVLDQQAVAYNRALGVCRAVGIVLCTIAGALLVACVLTSTLARVDTRRKQGEEEEAEEELLPENPPGKESPVGSASLLPLRASWVQNIQPKTETKLQPGPSGSAS